MTDKLSFLNYRLFKDVQGLEIKPITVIFGKNNSGKSSILHLPLLISAAFVCDEIFTSKFKGCALYNKCRDLIYGKASKSMTVGIEDSVSQTKLTFSFYVDEDKPIIEMYEIMKDGEAIYHYNIDEGDLGFKKLIPMIDDESLRNRIEEASASLSFDSEYLGAIRCDIPEYINLSELKTENANGAIFIKHLIEDSKNIAPVFSEKLSAWYADNFDGWQLLVDKQRDPVYEIVMKNGSLRTNITEVGKGISQTLPCVIRTFIPCKSPMVITVEEPECHLHPAAHAIIAQRFIDSVKEDKNKRYVIETHSKSFLLRLRRRIAEQELSKDDVAIYYVDFDEEAAKSNLKRINIDVDGSVDYWPKGIFEDSFDEAVALNNAQKNLKHGS